jgi:hypothetical protein
MARQRFHPQMSQMDADRSESPWKRPPRLPGAAFGFRGSAEGPASPHFFFATFLAGAALAAARFSSIAAWAAARRATGTRYGEQLT